MTDEQRFEKAEKVTKWDGVVVFTKDGDDYYSKIDHMRDLLLDDELPLPAYVWTCDTEPMFHLDADSIIEGIDIYVEFDPDDIVGFTEFKRACEAFNAANAHHVIYHPNYKRAFIVPEEWRKAQEDEDETGDERTQEHP